MEQTDVIDVDQISSFDDLLNDLENVKNQMQGPTTRAGTSVSVIIDENLIFQYLEEARDDPNRIETVCNRLSSGGRDKHSQRKMRKLDASLTSQDLGSNVSEEPSYPMPVHLRSDPVPDHLRPDPMMNQIRPYPVPDHLHPDPMMNQIRPDPVPDNLCPDPVLNHLLEMFPQLPVEYLKEKARNWSSQDIQGLVESILAGDNPPGVHDDSGVVIDGGNMSINDTSDALDETNLGDEIADTSIIENDSAAVSPRTSADNDVDENYQTLLNIFPDVDPDFLLRQSLSIGADPAKLEAFITASLENKSSLPSKKEYQKRMAKQNEQLKIKLLTVNDFLQLWEDPHAHFSDISSGVSDLYKEHALFQLRRAFPSLHHIHIVKALEESNYHFVPALKIIQNLPPKRGKKKQAPLPARPEEMDLIFLKEYVYSKLESKIRRHQATMEAKHNVAVEEARKNGGLFDCQCCFDGDCLLAEVAMCEEGHMFCKDCLRRGAAVQIGDQKTKISCLLDCGSCFSLAVLQSNLSPVIFSRLLQKRQLEEVAAAGLEDLVQCPACNFATIMPDPQDKVVRCRNPECGKESCRLCQEDNHIPLTCDEVEKDSDVADRVKLENAMSEAMIRTCVVCKKKFFKEEGCNMMKCTCGAKMCYICREPITSYNHFQGPNGCPPTSDNLNLHKYEVLEAASKAKKELNKTVKFDPTEALDMPPEGFNPLNHGNPFQGFNPQVVNGGFPFRGFNPLMNGGNPFQGFNPQVMNGRNLFQGFNPQVVNNGNPFQGLNPQPVNGENPFDAINQDILNDAREGRQTTRAAIRERLEQARLNMQTAIRQRRANYMREHEQELQNATRERRANHLRELEQAMQTDARERRANHMRELEQAMQNATRENPSLPRVRRGRRSRWPRQLRVVEPEIAEPVIPPVAVGPTIVPQEVPPVMNLPPVVEPRAQQVPQDEVIIVDDDSDLDLS